MKKLKVGIMPAEEMQQRVIDIVAGRYGANQSETKVWFESSKALGDQLKQNERFSKLEIDIETTTS